MSSDDPLDLTDLSKHRSVTNLQIAVAITSLAGEVRHLRDDLRDGMAALAPRVAKAEDDIRRLSATSLSVAEHRWLQDAKGADDEADATELEVRRLRLGAWWSTWAPVLVSLLSLIYIIAAHFRWV